MLRIDEIIINRPSVGAPLPFAVHTFNVKAPENAEVGYYNISVGYGEDGVLTAWNAGGAFYGYILCDSTIAVCVALFREKFNIPEQVEVSGIFKISGVPEKKNSEVKHRE